MGAEAKSRKEAHGAACVVHIEVIEVNQQVILRQSGKVLLLKTLKVGLRKNALCAMQQEAEQLWVEIVP